MRTVRTILVAVKDPDATPGATLLKAGQLARAMGAQLEIFHAIPVVRYPGFSPAQVREVEGLSCRRVLVKLERIAEPLRRQHLRVRVAAECDSPAYAAIIRHAGRIKADLVVAGLHSVNHSLAGLLKLTDWELLRFAPVPVLLIKTPGIYQQPAIVAAVDPGLANAKPGQLDARILSMSTALSRALRGQVHALHAYIPFPLLQKPHRPLNMAQLERLQSDLAAAAALRFERLLRTTAIPAAHRHLIARHPIDAIEQSARDLHGAIVVMGALARSGLRGMFFGNTAEAVLDNLTCDVLIVKPAGFTSRVSPQRNH